MNKGDILVYVGENNEQYKRGNKVEFSRDLGQVRFPNDNENYLLVINKRYPNWWKTEFGIVKSKDFVNLKTLREKRIDEII